MLRCDVFVDKVHKIEITTTTRELLLGESPEVFDVQAFDEEGESLLLYNLDSMCISIGQQVCFHSAMKHENDVSNFSKF